MRKVILALFVLFILQSCESEKDNVQKRIKEIDVELNYAFDYKQRFEKNYFDTLSGKSDTVYLYKIRDSLYSVTKQLNKERDSLEVILHGR